MVSGHLVEEPDLHLVADPEPPVDRRVLIAGRAVDQLPAHVGRGGHPVDLDHVVVPLDPAGRLVAGRIGLMPMGPVFVVVSLVLVAAAGLGDELRGQQLHSAFRAATRLPRDNLGVHGARVGGRRRLARQQLHSALRAVAGLLADDVFDEDGRLVHQRGVTASPGLHFMGLPTGWQHTRGSALLGWVKDDAEHLARHIVASRRAKPSRVPA